MIRLGLIIILFCSATTLHAQEPSEYRYIDQIALAIPSAQTNTTADIAAYIQKHFKTDEEKVRAAYTWVTGNIKYDKDSLHRVILEEDNNERVTFALRRKKGVCENFAAIFSDICLKSGVQSFFIDGLSAQNGRINREPHAWCAAKIEKDWFLFDPTWDAGMGFNGRSGKTSFYKIAPADFIQTHYPYDPIFQFLNYPLNFNEYSKNISSNRKNYFDYTDSIKVYQNTDSLSRFLSQLSRIERNQWTPSLIDTKRKQLKLEIELIYQDNDMANYNAAVNDYNVAIAILNNFLKYRNDQFLPAKTEEEVQQMFSNITSKIKSANARLNTINQSKATLFLDTGDVQKKLDDLVINVQQQQIFLKDYLLSRKEK